ncbi:hypothetical protein [Leuconostoc mesenteroides]|uniref:hypothetical protein n=1 Tax=Leuconostoc mesenteroides TaxID=1245 RepID=UPI0025A12015|nr:hypothetical protein [Leuconostoc mesenteroides]MDM7540039.1 hypothetical protein [Leuconostoc mesenteroides]
MDQQGFLEGALNHLNERQGVKKKNWEESTTENLANRLLVKNDLNSQIMTITVWAQDPDESMELVKGIVKVLERKVKTLISRYNRNIIMSNASLDWQGETHNI